MKRTIQRIANKDMKTCEGLQDIYVDFQESDIRNARALIMGPPGTCYENAILLFRIRFPNDYPFSPSSRIRSFQFHSDPSQFVCQWKSLFVFFIPGNNIDDVWSPLDIDYGFIFNFVVDSIIVK